MAFRVTAILAAAYILVAPLNADAARQAEHVSAVHEDDNLVGYVASMYDQRSTRKLVVACSRDGRVLVLMSGRKTTTTEDKPAKIRYSFDGASEVSETWKWAHPHAILSDGIDALSFISQLKTARSNLLFTEGASATVTFALNGSAGRVLKSTVTLCETLWEKGALRA